MNETAALCAVCNDPVEPHTDSLCGACGQTFHLNQREDIPGKDCGQVWINPEHLGLEFTCEICIVEFSKPPAELGPLQDILDLSEAAAVMGMPEGRLQALAQAGDVAHRRTGSGTFLFERAAVEAAMERLRS